MNRILFIVQIIQFFYMLILLYLLIKKEDLKAFQFLVFNRSASKVSQKKSL